MIIFTNHNQINHSLVIHMLQFLSKLFGNSVTSNKELVSLETQGSSFTVMMNQFQHYYNWVVNAPIELCNQSTNDYIVRRIYENEDSCYEITSRYNNGIQLICPGNELHSWLKLQEEKNK